MNINAETFLSQNPQVNINRSRFDMSHDHKFTANIGELVPIEVREVVAGDTFEYTTHRVMRMMPLVTPPMDDIFLDEYWFYCPTRILWTHTKNFYGENTESAYYPTTEYQIPQLNFKTIIENPDYDAQAGDSDDNAPNLVIFGSALGSVADHMGVPVISGPFPGDITGTNSDLTVNYATDFEFKVNALPFRAYAMICNEFFRSESLQNPIFVETNDATRNGFNNPDDILNYYSYVLSPTRGGHPFIASKVFDFFTACLPLPQRNAEPIMAVPQQFVYFGDQRSASDVLDDHDPVANYGSYLSSGTPTNSVIPIAGVSSTYQPNNWLVDGTSVNDIRVAFQVQKFYEALNRSGGRYRSVIQQLFGVTTPDASLQIPQFLGSSRTYFNIGTVLQTSETTNDSPLGSFAGTSHTSKSDYDFIQSFTEPGYIIGVAVARYKHSYESALDKMWMRKDFFDFYNPLFANIGELPVYNNNIYAQPFPANKYHEDNGIFGYNEAWADYRYTNDFVSGFFRSQAGALSFDNWTFTDQYDSTPRLGDEWIKEDKNNINRILNFQNDEEHKYPQYFCDFQFDIKATRPMPVHSIPGLVDHH